MRVLLLLLAVTMCVVGCRSTPQPPQPPAKQDVAAAEVTDATVAVVSDATAEAAARPAVAPRVNGDLEPFAGIWTYEDVWPGGRTHRPALYIGPSEDGSPTAAYVRQEFTAFPVLVAAAFDGPALRLEFHLVDYAGGGKTKHRITYMLTPAEGGLAGSFNPSWGDAEEITLTRVASDAYLKQPVLE